MDRWIRDLIAQSAAGLRALIDAVYQRVTWVYNVVVGVFLGIRNAWNDALNRIRHYVRSAARAAFEIAATLHWLAFIYVPQRIAATVGDVTRWALQQIQLARDLAQRLFDAALRWTLDRLNAIGDTISNIIRWATTTFNGIIDKLARTMVLVFTLLTDPKRLATWAIDAIVSEFLRWLDRNADRLMIALRARAIAQTLRFADRIEDMLRRLI